MVPRLETLIVSSLSENIGELNQLIADNPLLWIYKPILVQRLLAHVACGEQLKAAAMLRVQPTLALETGHLTDCAGRTFMQISAIQYAGWAYDTSMLTMLLYYLPKNHEADAAEQLDKLEIFKTEHGTHYDFSDLLKPMQKAIYRFNVRGGDIIHGGAIAQAQRLVPAHIANEYCYPKRPFSPLPNFMHNDLPRSFEVHLKNNEKINWFQSPSSQPIMRNSAWTTAFINIDWVAYGDLLADYEAMAALSYARKTLYADIRMRLSHTEKLERLKSFTRIYQALKAGKTQKLTDVFKHNFLSEIQDKFLPDQIQTIKSHSVAYPKGLCAKAWKLSENSQRNSLLLFRDIYLYSYQHSGFFKRSRLRDLLKKEIRDWTQEEYQIIRRHIQYSNDNTRTGRIRNALQK